MKIYRRSYLYIRRKTGRSILLSLVMLLLFSLVMIGILLHHTTDAAIRQTRQSIGGSFRIAPDMQNQENVAISAVDGQTSVTYIGEPLDEKLIQTILAGQEIDAYNAVIRGEALFPEELNLIDYNGTYQNDVIASRLISVEADTDFMLSGAFQKKQVKLVESGIVNLREEGTAIISQALALQNNLQIGDEIRLSPREGGMGISVSVKIGGFFTIETTQQNTDIASPIYLLENKIFLAPADGGTLTGATEADYVDFFVSDPARVYDIMAEIRKAADIDWKCFSVTADTDDYEKAARPLLSMRKLADTLLSILGTVSITVLSLIQILFNKSRRHETGIMLSNGISKGEILLQHFLETSFLAAAAFVFAVCISFAAWPYIYRSIFNADTIDVIHRTGTAAMGMIAAITGGCGIFVLFLSVTISNLWDMRLSPMKILSKLS